MNKLTKAEEQLMHMIWEYGPSTVSQLIKKMEEPHPPHSSISTIIRILERKEFVGFKVYGRTHEYFAKVPKSEYSKFSIKNLLTGYFEGSLNNMVSFLVEENDLSLKDLAEMVDVLKDKKNKL